MSITLVLARIAELQGASAIQASPPVSQTPVSSTAPGSSAFGDALAAQTAAPAATAASYGSGAAPVGGSFAVGGAAVPATGGSAASRRVQLAAGEVGIAEQPPGSNDAPRIADYRQAVKGYNGVGPWCAYFASWASSKAGTPLGENGQGFAAVDDVYAWAQRTGRALPGSATPQPGDLIIWDEHMGIVESVDANGKVRTIEGNSSDQVARREYAPGSALGYVRMG